MNKTTWDTIISTVAAIGGPSTVARKLVEFNHARWNKLKKLPLSNTGGSDFLKVMNAGGVSTACYLASVQTMALETGQISHPILPKRLWPKREKKFRRAITKEEHCRLAHHREPKWAAYLELLWQTGASQSDAAQLQIELTDMDKGIITYRRMKTGTRAAQKISPSLMLMLKKLAGDRKRGYFIPHIAHLTVNARSSCFRKKCLALNIHGVSLHSYRYGWAERAFELGVPERLAMVALGHNSRAIHQAYAKGAKLVCLSLEEYKENPPTKLQGELAGQTSEQKESILIARVS